MKKWHDFDSSILIALEFEKSGCCEELLAFSWQPSGHVYELIIIDPLGAVVGLRDILLEKVPQLLEILLF